MKSWWSTTTRVIALRNVRSALAAGRAIAEGMQAQVTTDLISAIDARAVPGHYTSQIVSSLSEAIEMGLHLPIVYNCSGYESIEVIRLLEGIVDIYMPDIKFMDEEYSKRYSNAPDYTEVVRNVLKEMHRQVGDLTMNSRGIAQRGLLIRHLVMPGGVASSESVLKFIAEEISVHTYVNIMDQYRPEYRAHEYAEISRRITHKEYLDAIQFARSFCLHRGF